MLDKRRVGRPSGRTDTRDRVLRAARERFTTLGYAKTTMRMIASDVDVDVSTVAHHFGHKHQLFTEAMALQLGPSEAISKTLSAHPDHVGAQLIQSLLDSWDSPETGPALRAFAAVALQHEDVRHAFSEYMTAETTQLLVGFVGGRDASDRALAAMTVLAGIVLTRYLLQLPPAAEMPADRYRDLLAPLVAACLARPSSADRPRRRW